MLATRNIFKENGEKLGVFPLENTHDCSQFTVLTSEEEMVCIKCGRVCDEDMQEYLFEMGAVGANGKALTNTDHNVGNGLFSSQTIQSGYISKANPGQAFILGRGSKAKDYQGKRVEPQLKDGYKTGIVADPTRGCCVVEDVLTGKKEVKFSRYDAPLLPKIQLEALQRCIGYRLDVVQQTLISKELKRVYGHLCMGAMPRYITLCALLNNRHLLPKSAVEELEKEMTKCVEELRDKILSGCASKQV